MRTFHPDVEEFISCDCHGDGLLLGHMDDSDDFVYVALWSRNPGPTGWGHRLHHIWHILRHGDPYGDEVVLSRGSVERLRKFCDCALEHGVYGRPWITTLRSGEWTSASNTQATVSGQK